MRSSSYFKTISQILILAMLHLCWLTSYGYAEMVLTESAVQFQTDRQRLLDLLDRQEVIDELDKYGISKVEAVARINSLTDEEVTKITGKLDELPEGGDFALALVLILPLFLAVYIPGVIIKGIGCIFIDCKDSIFKPWWLESADNKTSKERPASVPVEEDCDPGMESCT